MPNAKQDSTVYLDPVTNQYYTQQTYRPIKTNRFLSGSGGLDGIGGFNANDLYGGMGGTSSIPQTVRNYTGDISVVNRMMQNRQPYQYNVPSVASMFPSMAMPMMNFNQGTGGAGQFLGGLLGNSPMLSQANAPASSGAGRFA
jgi:hypothetical protein